MNYNWNWGIFFEPSPEGTGTYLDMLLSGLRWTIVTALCAWVIALVFGSIVGVMRTLPSRTAGWIATAYVEFFRNIPLIVQLFLWYFVLPELLPRVGGSVAEAASQRRRSGPPSSASASTCRRAWPSRCGPASGRCRAARPWRARRWG